MRGGHGQPAVARRAIRAARVPQRDRAHDGGEQKDRRGDRQQADVQGLQRPSPLVDRGEDDGQREQQPPALFDHQPGDGDVDGEQVREHRERIVLRRRQQVGVDESAADANDGDEERVAPPDQEHRGGGDDQHADERHGQRHERPARVHGVERRVEDGDARGVERARGDLRLRGDEQLGHGDQRGAGDEPDRRRFGGAEQVNRSDDQRHGARCGEEPRAVAIALVVAAGRRAHSVFRYSTS